MSMMELNIDLQLPMRIAGNTEMDSQKTERARATSHRPPDLKLFHAGRSLHGVWFDLRSCRIETLTVRYGAEATRTFPGLA